jgi:hypothetical protein
MNIATQKSVNDPSSILSLEQVLDAAEQAGEVVFIDAKGRSFQITNKSIVPVGRSPFELVKATKLNMTLDQLNNMIEDLRNE